MTSRTIRSSAVPATTRPRPEVRPEARPRLHVVTGGKAGAASGFGRMLQWAGTRSARTLHVVISVAFLASTLFGALMLRTQMVQNSFASSKLESSISRLTQDVQDDQAKLDQLQASLPQKASDMGMIPQHDSVSIDLQGYQEDAQ